MTVEFDAGTITNTDQLEALGLSQAGQNVIYDATALAITQGTGLQLNYAAGPANSIDVRGTLLSSAIAASTVTLATADATNPRVDLVHVDSSGNVGKTDGVAAADPVPPDLAADEMALAHVYVAQNATSIVTADITDKRQYIKNPIFPVYKTADETVNNSTTLQDDDHLVRGVEASAEYSVEGMIIFHSTAVADYKAAFAIPAGATLEYGALRLTGASLTFNAIAGATNVTADGGGAGTNQAYSIKGHLTIDTTAGNLQYQWAQNTGEASNTVTVKGSWMRLQKLSA